MSASRPSVASDSRRETPPIWQAAAVWLVGTLLAAQTLQTWLSSQVLAGQLISTPTWMRLVAWLSGQSQVPVSEQADVSYLRVLMIVGAIHLATWLMGSVLLSWRRSEPWLSSVSRWGIAGGGWWCLLGLWDWVNIAVQVTGVESLVNFWGVIPSFWCAGSLAGWMTTGLVLLRRNEDPESKLDERKDSVCRSSTFNLPLWSFIAVYVVVFVTMNWRLYFNLLIPHGDSAMYEEHLWNVLHGKGFRSYLDQGLFLGEHIQVVHLGLLPIYVLWPSHLLLELCESLALALGAWPVYWMTRRQTQSHAAGLAAAAAYLCYAPMQFLDIEVDLKTFRPEAFGIPIFLLTLDQLDRRNLWGTLAGIVGCLTVKEDYAIVLAPLGVWMAVVEGGRRTWEGGSQRHFDRNWALFGFLVAVGAVGYLFLATRVVMPWFRSGAEIHYASYFSKFGQSPEQIVRTMLTQPGLLFGELFSLSTMLYALAMLAPLAFVPVLSPSRLAVGLPLFGILCLNELARDPRHQFHAPLVPIVFWALAGGWGRGQALLDYALKDRCKNVNIQQALSGLVWTSSLATGFFFSLSPLSMTFWDPGSAWYWQTLYGPNQRAVEFAKIANLIPKSARVASTDFVHPRYTHFERSYDYSHYRRKVSGYEAKVPDDTNYIVIDTRHKYSELKTPRDVPEYRDHPEEWELMPDETDGYFIVLQRRKIDP
ncbi:MAG: DUF2079 domain-containing protein [Planctomycetaceae bacterium]